MRFLTVPASIMTMVVLLVLPAMGQGPGLPGYTPTAPGLEQETEAGQKTKEVEGTVRKVDAAKKSIRVSSGLLGLTGATLEVANDTQIQVQGKPGSFADIRQGEKVKASYETRNGRNVAKSIEVVGE